LVGAIPASHFSSLGHPASGADGKACLEARAKRLVAMLEPTDWESIPEVSHG
jgi:hypothetical protein